jgi:hypothetical protein
VLVDLETLEIDVATLIEQEIGFVSDLSGEEKP